MLVSLILYICGSEDAETVRETAEMLAGQKTGGAFEVEIVIAAADNAGYYAEVVSEVSAAVSSGSCGISGIKLADLGKRVFQNTAQLKNAALPYAAGELAVFVQPGEIWPEDMVCLLVGRVGRSDGENINADEKESGCAGADRVALDSPDADEKEAFYRLLGDGDQISGPYIFSKRSVCECGGFNGRLSCGEEFELALRILDANGSAGFMSGAADKPLYREHFYTYAYVLGRYAAKLRECGELDGAIMLYLKAAQNCGLQEYFIGLLEKMVSKQEEYYSIDSAVRPVLIYTGDPICFDVLRSFAQEFAGELERQGIPVIIYDMEQEGTTGLAQFAGEHFRAVVGFQTALFSVRMKNSDILVNNIIRGAKINFLYDHPLYLYYHFTLELDDYFVLTQDEDYAKYINKHYPLIKKSYHLPPAGIELSKSERVSWEEKIYDIVFVASYHDYRERTLALRMQMDEQVRPVAEKLLEEMKTHPDLTAEEALASVLETEGTELSSTEFASLLNKCMDACRVVMFYYREKVMETLLDAGLTIHVFGGSWQNCPLASRNNLIIHPDVSYMEGIRIMARSKIALNVMSWHKAGMTERVANTMLNRTVCLTDSTKYLVRHFEDEKDIAMFDLNRLEELPDKVAGLLGDEEKMKRIADAGYENASVNHRWKNRVEDFIDMACGGAFDTDTRVLVYPE